MSVAQARAILDAKIALELEVMKPIDHIGMAYIRAWEMNGGQPHVHDRRGFEIKLEDVLLNHYARVVSVFQGKRPKRTTRVEDVAVSLAHLDSLRARAQKHAAMVFSGIDREFQTLMRFGGTHVEDGITHFDKASDWPIEVKDDVIAPKLPEGASVGYWGKLRAAVGKVIGKFKAKVPTIANANTNPVAEQARGVDVEVVPDAQANVRIEKEWTSLMDGRERPAHHAAHEQTVGTSQAFTVGGEQLRFPGDGELGASLWNLINCRCYLRYFAVDRDGNRTEIHRSPSYPTRRFKRPANPNHPVPGFRGPVEGPALRPTSLVTLNGGTVAKVVLGDARTIATLRQETPTTLTMTVGRTQIARATMRDGKITQLHIDPAYREQGIEKLLRDSAKHSFERDKRPFAERVPR